MITRSGFHEQLGDLKREILRTGTVVSTALEKAVQSLKELNGDLAREVVAEDDRIDNMMMQVENHCLELLALQQPMAKDLRHIGTALKLITDLERMGDHAVNIARVTLRLEGQQLVKPLVDIPRMAELALSMAGTALKAYVDGDADLAATLAQQDHKVDALYKQVVLELEEFMRNDPSTIQQALQLIFVARDLERVADHTTNLGEWIIYMITGDRPLLND